MNLVFEKITQTFAASASVRTNIAGNFFRLSVAAYPVSISLLKDFRIIGTMNNMLAGDYVKDIDFDGVIITNGATGQAITFQIAGGGAGSDRVLGEVSVINGEIARVKAGNSFIGYSVCSPVAGQYSHCQIWNPSAVKNVILNKISVLTSVQQLTALNTSVAALTAISGASANKLIGGAAPVAEMRGTAYAASQGVTVTNFAYPTSLESVDYPFSEPILLGPSKGIIMQCNLVNTIIYASWQWNEEAI